MKRNQVVGLVFVVIAIGAIISTVYNADTYASFADAKAMPGREFHIIGELVPDKPILEEVVDNTLTLRFHLDDGHGGTSEVLYFGGKPTDFGRSDEVVLIGSYQEDIFVASSILLKCPSKYKPDEAGPTEYQYDQAT